MALKSDRRESLLIQILWMSLAWLFRPWKKGVAAMQRAAASIYTSESVFFDGS
ncbi:MAG: hypothetical protein HQL97_05210 [Magnetococcales bacterium]|nr:hypothetical protein [Magnetococcales bacterium]MBF0261227.1 hypothetical protein [Magnetococcales bacterium]